MKYIIILAVVVLGGYFAFQQYAPQKSSGTLTETSIMDPINAAKIAAEQLEGHTPETKVMNEKGKNDTKESAVLPGTTATTIVAGGCFWCVESDLEKLPGVKTVVSGYAGGTTDNPTYQNYTTGGHREVVEVTYDPTVVSFEAILIYAMKHMDPTDGEGSFGDRGKYYTPAFYYKNETEKKIITDLIAEVNDKGPYDKPLAIAVESTPKFWAAEDYHQDYYKGTLSNLKYKYYRNASGRDTFIAKYWGTDTKATLPWRKEVSQQNVTSPSATTNTTKTMNDKKWLTYVKPSADILKAQLDTTTFKVTQEEGTEKSSTSPLDKNYERGIYVDVLSGEPLYSSKDKFDSGTGWPSFVRPITSGAVTEHEDNTFFSKRTEVRSKIADNHLGHVFTDGPKDRGGLRYCMNGVALKFIAENDMEAAGYGEYKNTL